MNHDIEAARRLLDSIDALHSDTERMVRRSFLGMVKRLFGLSPYDAQMIDHRRRINVMREGIERLEVK